MTKPILLAEYRGRLYRLKPLNEETISSDQDMLGPVADSSDAGDISGLYETLDADGLYRQWMWKHGNDTTGLYAWVEHMVGRPIKGDLELEKLYRTIENRVLERY